MNVRSKSNRKSAGAAAPSPKKRSEQSNHTHWERFTFMAQIIGTVSALLFGFLAYLTSNESLQILKDIANTDLEYKKLSIHPIISVQTNAALASISFKNIGLGTAKVVRLIVQYGNYCIDSDKADNFHDDLIKFIDYTIRNLAFDMKLSRGGLMPAGMNATTTSLIAGQFIKSDQDWTPFKLQTELPFAGDELDRHNKQWKTFINFDFRYQLFFTNVNNSVPISYAVSTVTPYCS